MFGLPYDPEKLRAFARCQTMADLFHDRNVGSPVRVRADGYEWTLEHEPPVAPPFQIKAGRVELSQFEKHVFFGCRHDFDAALKAYGAFSPHLGSSSPQASGMSGARPTGRGTVRRTRSRRALIVWDGWA
jgi:hypothetical protein